MPRANHRRALAGRVAWPLVVLAPLLALSMLTLDVPVHAALKALDDDLTDRLGALSILGDSKWYLVPLGIGGITCLALRHAATRLRPRLALGWLASLLGFAFVAIASSGLLAVALKYGIGRARPKLLDEHGAFAFQPFAMDADFAALPSGHANTVFVVALILVFLWPRWRVLWLGLAAWIAFSRVLIEAHYLTDVIAGGLLAGLTTYVWRDWFAARRLLFERRRDGAVALRGRRLLRWLTRHPVPALAVSGRRPPLVWGLAPAMASAASGPVATTMAAVGSGLTEAPPAAWLEPRPPPEAATAPDADAIEVSVVVPVRDEAPNILPLLEEIETALRDEAPFEVVCVDDGSRDRTREALARARERFPWLRCLGHAAPCGQSAAIRTGVLAARGRIVVTIDGDGQNDPADIPRLLAALRDPNAAPHVGMVAGQRRRRADGWAKRRASVIANGVRARLLGDGSRDTGCGLKAMTRETFLMLPYFDHMHRFLPALIKREGRTVRFVDVAHRPRRGGRSKYGILDRLGTGLIDLLGVAWLMRRRRVTDILER